MRLQPFLLPVAVFLLALWVLLDNTGSGLSETWDVVFAVAAGVLAAIDAALLAGFGRDDIAATLRGRRG
mgnify:CR=1 FL=1